MNFLRGDQFILYELFFNMKLFEPSHPSGTVPETFYFFNIKEERTLSEQ